MLMQTKDGKAPLALSNQPPSTIGGRQLQYDPGGDFPMANSHHNHNQSQRQRRGVVDEEEGWDRTRFHQDYPRLKQGGTSAFSGGRPSGHRSGRRPDDNNIAGHPVGARNPASSGGSGDGSDKDDEGGGKSVDEEARGSGGDHRWDQEKDDEYDDEYDWAGAPHDHDSDAHESEAAAELEDKYRHKHVSTGTMPVDLRLAQTYVPAFMCLLRCSALIIVISRPWACYSLPVHACLGAVIYVDRVARSEVILDSNALMGTLLFAHTVNAFRCAPDQHALYLAAKVPISQPRQQQELVHQKQLAVAAILHQERNSSTTALHDWPHGTDMQQQQQQQGGVGSAGHVHVATFVGEVSQAAYIVNSLLLVWGLDMSAAGAALLLTMGASCALLFGASPLAQGPRSSLRRRSHMPGRPISSSSSPLPHLKAHQGHQHLLSSSYGGSVCRVCTVVCSGLLLVGFTQTPVDKFVGMAPVSIMSRSFMFLCLCLVWSYTAGIHDMVQLLQGSPRGPILVSLTVPQPNGRARACRVHATIAQSFIPCQLRFTCVLFLHGSTLYLVTGCMTVLLLHYVLKIKNATTMATRKQGDAGKQGAGLEGDDPDDDSGAGEQAYQGERFAATEGPMLRIRKVPKQNSRKLLHNKEQYHQHHASGRVHGAPGSLTELEELSTWSLDNMVHPDYRIPNGAPAGGETDICSGESVARAMLGHSETPGVFINATAEGTLTGSTPCEVTTLSISFCMCAKQEKSANLFTVKHAVTSPESIVRTDRVFPAASPVTLASAWTPRSHQQQSQAEKLRESVDTKASTLRQDDPVSLKLATTERLHQASPWGHHNRRYAMDPTLPQDPQPEPTKTAFLTHPTGGSVLQEDALQNEKPSAPPLLLPSDSKEQPTDGEDPSKLLGSASTAAPGETGEGTLNEGSVMGQAGLLSRDDPDIAPSLFAGLNISVLQEAGSMVPETKGGGEEDFNSTLKLFMQAVEASQQQQQPDAAADVQKGAAEEGQDT